MSTGTLVDVVMPQMGVSVSEGTVVTWRKQVGDTIKADETIVEISTDKVDTEVPSPATGTVREILVPEGETVDVGTRIAVIDTGGGGRVPLPRRLPRLPRPRLRQPRLRHPPSRGTRRPPAAPGAGRVARRRTAGLGRRAALPGDARGRRARPGLRGRIRRRRERREPRPALVHVARRRAHGGRARARHLADRGHRPRRPRDQEGRRGAPRRRRSRRGCARRGPRSRCAGRRRRPPRRRPCRHRPARRRRARAHPRPATRSPRTCRRSAR